MTKNASFLFTASCLSLFVPVPPRFAYGLVLVLCANVIVFSVILLHAFIDYLGITKGKTLFSLIGTMGITVLLYALLTLWSPLTAFTLGFIIYLIPVSSVISDTVFTPQPSSLRDEIRKGAKLSLLISSLGLSFFALRELFSYGSLSLPARTGLRILWIFGNFRSSPVFFWSAIPGALILLALLLTVLMFVYRRYEGGEEAQK
ncbi:hypothetical protein [Treponema maltophilum]|uniref:Uncharacterized protein n=1 Tax=Treponema maltophilum ATCC 51939 TaxID=1125699 RepID=S3JXM9_TREMA|nr:hypothetical protein [Treponema maltophilum]EPF30718.1 hypothetical protein HMPREF9194_01037 [Treponema maltophilum ATCC 51939]